MSLEVLNPLPSSLKLEEGMWSGAIGKEVGVRISAVAIVLFFVVVSVRPFDTASNLETSPSILPLPIMVMTMVGGDRQQDKHNSTLFRHNRAA